MLMLDPGLNGKLVRDRPVLIRGPGGGAPPPVDYVALVQTLLSGTPGWATDPADTSINFKTGPTPVTAPGVDTIARADSKFGTTVYTWANATVASQFLWNGASWEADGVDDFLQSAAGYAFASSLAGETITFRALPDTLTTQVPFAISHSTANLTRRTFQFNADGSITLQSRRANGDSPLTLVSTAGVLSAGVEATIQSRINFSTDAVDLLVDGVVVGSGTQTGTSGAASDASNTSRVRFGTNLSGAAIFNGKLGCFVYAPFAADSTQMASCRGFVERNAL